MKKMKNAWLITWESDRPINDNQKIIHFFSTRYSSKYVADFVEQFYLMTTISAGDAIYYMNRKSKIPCKPVIENSKITCGLNPWVYARQVTKLEVNNRDGIEVISWKEPDNLGLTESDEIVVKQKGQYKEIRRTAKALLKISN